MIHAKQLVCVLVAGGWLLIAFTTIIAYLITSGGQAPRQKKQTAHH